MCKDQRENVQIIDNNSSFFASKPKTKRAQKLKICTVTKLKKKL
jgi:hypothetical protein